MEILANCKEKRSWVEINISQLRANYRSFQKVVGDDVRIMTVVKADAYGHGDVQVARMMEEEGCSLFAVSNIDEAIGLRKAGVNGEILILGYSSPGYVKEIKEYDLTQTIVSEDYALVLSSTGIPIKCQFAIDTGMNRIGLDADDSIACERVIRTYCRKLIITGIFTHLCVADSDEEDDKSFTRQQLYKFNKLATRISDLKLPLVHCLNSAGGLTYLSEIKDFPLINRIVRLGIVLYGLKPSSNFRLLPDLQAALTWKSVISMVKTISSGESVGYGRYYVAEQERKIATVTTGYADGLNRGLSNKGFVLIRGQKAPIVGRICMDQTLVDVSDIPNVKMGDTVIILGASGGMEYNADDMAEDLDTIGYEITCNISKRVQRFYYNSNVNL